MLANGNDPTTIEVIADIAQVVIGLAALLSIWIGLISLREVRRERILRVRPWLAFEHGGQGVSCEEVETQAVPGIDPAYVRRVLGERKRPVRMPTSHWGKLRNHGGGVALDVRVTFITSSATVGHETYKIELSKLKEFPYDPRLNAIPADPSHIHPGEDASFFRIPTPIFERGGDREVITGVAVLSCRDVLDRRYFRYQKFRAGVEAVKDAGFDGVLVTFGDEFNSHEAREKLGDLAQLTPGLNRRDESRAKKVLRQLTMPPTGTSST